jgi:SnoaL-like domain
VIRARGSYEIQELSDRQAIADLITRLGRMLDDKRFDDAEAILADEVTVQTPGGLANGREAVVAQARRNHTVRTQHVLTDVLIELEGNRALASANLIVTFAPDAPDSRLTLGERYSFEVSRGASGWRLTRVEVESLWSSAAAEGTFVLPRIV